MTQYLVLVQALIEKTNNCLPAKYRKVTCACSTPTTSTFTFAAVHREAEEHTIRLNRRYNIRPGHATIVRAYFESELPRDTNVVIEPRLLTAADEFESGEFPPEFELVLVSRTLTKWHAKKDGSVYLQVLPIYRQSL